MNFELVEKIARAVLYEGYLLYPYRPSAVKNQQRWNFGVLYPRAYCQTQAACDAWSMQTECLIEGSAQATLQVKVKFLQMVERALEQAAIKTAEQIDVTGTSSRCWQEGVEREVGLPQCRLEDLIAQPFLWRVTFAAENRSDGSDDIMGAVVRRGQSVSGEIALSAERVREDVYKLCVGICNTGSLEDAASASREEALLYSLVSAHTILGVQNGQFISAIDPPEELRELAATCKNVGNWPVLVGAEGQREIMLSSPIILYDYPQIAPESAGDLFDGTEIDEILSLRIMTMTDEEKREMRESDERARQILERTETLPAEQLMKLHGVLRGLRPVKENAW